MNDTDHNEGFFRDVSEDNHIKSKSRQVKSGLVELKRVKKFVSRKTKGHSKIKKSSVKPPPTVKKSLSVRSEKAQDKILDISPDLHSNQAADSKQPNDSELKSSKETRKKVKVKYDLDTTNKHLVQDLENNNHTDETKVTFSTRLPADNLPNRKSSKKKQDNHRRLVEWTNNEPVLQVLSTWEEKASRYPEMRQEIIAGVTMSSGELHFIVDWDGDRWKVKAEEAYRRIPMTCLKYYERLLVWDTN